MTKKQLRAELEKAYNEIESLKADVENLKKQRTQLVEEKEDIIKNVKKKAMEKIESMRSIEHIDKSTDEVFLKLSENLAKSLKAKNLINMTAEERDSVYYMFERFMQLGEEKKAVLEKRGEEAKAEVNRLTERVNRLTGRVTRLTEKVNTYTTPISPLYNHFCSRF